MRRIFTLLLAVFVGAAFAAAALPEAARAHAPDCHEMRMQTPAPARPAGAVTHTLHACCLFCAGVELRAPLEDRPGAVRVEAVRFSVAVAALSGRKTPPALGPPKRFV